VICFYYLPNGAVDDIREAFRAVLDSGDPNGGLLEAVDKLKAIARMATGEQKQDASTLANQLAELVATGDASEMLDYTDPFYAKYAEMCDQPTG
jgi:hypothetical protein